MYTIPLILLILVAVAITLNRNGVGSFVTLGIIGAAIYTVPAVIDMQISLATVSSSFKGYVAIPDDVRLVVVMAWGGMIAGLMVSSLLFPKMQVTRNEGPDKIIESVGIASALLALLGILYLSLISERTLFFLAQRADQDTGAVALLWKWTPLIGLVACALSRQRKLLLFQLLVLFMIFVRGDRTLVAIATAATIATASFKDPKWYTKLKPSWITALCVGAVGVFFGKSAYLTLKSGLVSGDWSPTALSLQDQFLTQFEPLGTFNHLEYVMRSGVTIAPLDFFISVFGNALLIPSFFGVSTNLYNSAVTATLSPRLGFGVAGNYLAHGYTVAGTIGAVLFYFILPPMLRLCDGQFRAKQGSVKVFWCCVGAVLAFYIHRNGLDNEFSFVRQILIVSVVTAAMAAALRHLGFIGAPVRAMGPGEGTGASPSGEFLISASTLPENTLRS